MNKNNIGICDIRMKYFHDNGLKFLPVKQNLVDQLWVDKPALPSKPVRNFLLKL